jgi:hypothetical protein
MSFFKRLVHPAEPNTKASARRLKGNEVAETASASSPTDELFSTVGDYGLQTLSENADDIIE